MASRQVQLSPVPSPEFAQHFTLIDWASGAL
jgi:hypothetical protein